jgi:hypothetical protein
MDLPSSQHYEGVVSNEQQETHSQTFSNYLCTNDGLELAE